MAVLYEGRFHTSYPHTLYHSSYHSQAGGLCHDMELEAGPGIPIPLGITREPNRNNLPEPTDATVRNHFGARSHCGIVQLSTYSIFKYSQDWFG